MKPTVLFLTSSTIFHSVHSWSLPPTAKVRGQRQQHASSFGVRQQQVSRCRPLSSATLASPTATTSSGSSVQDEEDAWVVVAEGSIVSHFAGGLTAVRINEDSVVAPSPSEEENETPEEVSVETIASSPFPPTLSSLTTTTTTTSTAGDLQGHVVQFADGSKGVVVAHRPPVVFVVPDDESNAQAPVEGPVQIGQTLQSFVRTNADDRTTVTALGGRSSNESSDTDESAETASRPLFAPIPQVADITLINAPLVTGVTMMDALAPIGKGQNMLMVGHDVQEMRRYCMDLLQTQLVSQATAATTDDEQEERSSPPRCIYCAIDDDAMVETLLEERGIRDQVQMVVVPNDDDGSSNDEASRAARAVAASATACAMAEVHALEDGADTLVIIDTIDAHKTFWDSSTRVLVDVFGVEAVVQGDRDGGASSEMRAFYSSLIQRAAQYNDKHGGGSVTLVILTSIPRVDDANDTNSGSAERVFTPEDFAGAGVRIQDRIQLLVRKKIPLTASNLRKIEIPIPSDSEGRRRLVLQHVDDLISMSDGQIWLDETLEQQGTRPPMDPQRSVTRVGIGADTDSRADAPALRRVVEGLRLTLAQASDQLVVADGGGQAAATQKQMRKHQALLLAMHQGSGLGGRRLSESCAALLAASEGLLDDAVATGATAGTGEGAAVMTGLLTHLQSTVPHALQTIDQTLDMPEETRAVLLEAIEAHVKSSN